MMLILCVDQAESFILFFQRLYCFFPFRIGSLVAGEYPFPVEEIRYRYGVVHGCLLVCAGGGGPEIG